MIVDSADFRKDPSKYLRWSEITGESVCIQRDGKTVLSVGGLVDLDGPPNLNEDGEIWIKARIVDSPNAEGITKVAIATSFDQQSQVLTQLHATVIKGFHFRQQVCNTCEHGAGWHGGVLAENCWKAGYQTALSCEHDNCNCDAFVGKWLESED